jgi:hypothetical protein
MSRAACRTNTNSRVPSCHAVFSSSATRPSLRSRRRSCAKGGRKTYRASRSSPARSFPEPLEFLERLAAMTPRPETNLLICHGLLAARARWRARVVAYGRVEPASTPPAPAVGPGEAGAPSTAPAWTWAALMHRALTIDVLACASCGGRLRLIATPHNPVVIRKLLAHVGMARSGPSPGPAPPAP